MHFEPESLRFRLTLWMSLSTFAVLSLLLAVAFGYARDFALRRGADDLLARHRITAAGLHGMFAGIEAKGREIRAQLYGLQASPAQLSTLLGSRVLHDPDIGSILVALEAGNQYAGDQRFAIYVGYSAEGVLIRDFIVDKYQFWTRAWYQRALADASPWWSDPYFNESSGGQDTVTLDMPLADDQGRPQGVMGLDLTLDRVAQRAGELGLLRMRGDREYTLVAADGRIVMHSDAAFERAHSLEQAVARSGSATLRVLLDAGITQADVPSLHTVSAGGEQHLVTVSTIPGSGWRLSTSMAESELLAPLHAMAWRLATAAVLVMLALAALLSAIAGRITRPLQQLSLAAVRIADGDFDFPLPRGQRRRDELTRLVDGFERARAAIREQLARLQSVQLEQRRIEGELDVAHRIQLSMLPDDRTFFGSELEVEVAGKLRPASAVGGDFYGFLAPAPGICFFHVGDVSGRGVPAALFMARLSTLLPALVRQGGTPADLLRRVADTLDQDQDQGLYASLLIGRLDLGTGELCMASAGHPPPLLLRADGGQHALDVRPGGQLGSGDATNRAWPLWQGRLQPGERLLAYTNGATDAQDTRGHRFELEQLQVACARQYERSPRELVRGLLEEIARFIGAAEQNDDIALLLLDVRHRD